MGPHAGRVGDGAKGRSIPEARLGQVVLKRETAEATRRAHVEPPYDRLPPHEQALHAWASVQPALDEAENSQREWSAEYFAKWVASSQKGSLGSIPLIVLTRAQGGYGDALEKPAVELERIRLEAQAFLAQLSTAATQRIVKSGHNMHLEAPGEVVSAIGDLVAKIHSKK